MFTDTMGKVNERCKLHLIILVDRRGGLYPGSKCFVQRKVDRRRRAGQTVGGDESLIWTMHPEPNDPSGCVVRPPKDLQLQNLVPCTTIL